MEYCAMKPGMGLAHHQGRGAGIPRPAFAPSSKKAGRAKNYLEEPLASNMRPITDCNLPPSWADTISDGANVD
jgi:hypothetical protein